MNMPTQFQIDVAVAHALRDEAGRLLRTARGAVPRFLARWWRHRQAARMSASLHTLDARTLRDLGFDRSEIDSVVAEISGDARCTRVVARLARRHSPR
jgi:uncharacterized protein YjiS (DUF1127 family)